jgi:cell wall-associated NlpC family hydrolase
MTTKQEFVDKAREFIGIPFRHQGRTIHGVDCAGLLYLTAKELGVSTRDETDYGRLPDPKRMLRLLSENMDRIPIEEAVPGDVYWMRFGVDPQHLALVTDKGIIHSYSEVRKGSETGRVVEHTLNKTWKDRITSCWRIKGLT